MDEEEKRFNSDFKLVKGQLEEFSDSEAETVKSRLNLGVPTHFIVEEILSRRRIEKRVNDLVNELRDVISELTEKEYSDALGAVRAGREVQAVANALKSAVAQREKIRRDRASGPVEKL